MKKITIGREDGPARRLAIYVNDQFVSFLGEQGSVPTNVSRQHCEIEIDDNHQMFITNKTNNNLVFVNGSEYNKDCKKAFKVTDKIELGPSRFPLKINEVLKCVNEELPWKIAHLKDIFDNHRKKIIEDQKTQALLNALSTVPTILMMGSGVAFYFIENSALKILMISFAVIMMIVLLVLRIKIAKYGPVRRQNLEDEFRKQYVCPHCKKHLGNMRYEELVSAGKCPYCHCTFVE